MRDYPVDISTEALQKASNLTIEEALKSSTSERNNEDVITFVCTVNPSLPNTGKLINQYLDLSKLSTSESVRRLYESIPIVAYKRPTNIHDMLVHSKLSRPLRDFNVTKCDRRRCTHCSPINESNLFTSTTTSSVHKICNNLSCTSTDVLYLFTCTRCNAQYVG